MEPDMTDTPRPHKVEFAIDLMPMSIRFLYMQSHYRQPLDFSEARLESAHKTLRRLVMAATPTLAGPPLEIIEAMSNDLNTPKALAIMATYRARGEGEKLFAALRFLGFFGDPVEIAELKTMPEDGFLNERDRFGGMETAGVA
jgi:hypothetical protein